MEPNDYKKGLLDYKTILGPIWLQNSQIDYK